MILGGRAIHRKKQTALWILGAEVISCTFFQEKETPTEQVYQASLPVQAQDVVGTLLEILQKGTLRPYLEATGTHSVALDPSLIRLRMIQLPPMREEEIREALQGELGGDPLFRQTEVHPAFSSLENGKLLAAGVDQILLEKIQSVFKERDLPLERVVPLPLALLAGEATRSPAKLYLGCTLLHSSLYAILFYEKRPIAIHTLDIGTDPLETAEEIKHLVLNLQLSLQSDGISDLIEKVFVSHPEGVIATDITTALEKLETPAAPISTQPEQALALAFQKRKGKELLDFLYEKKAPLWKTVLYSPYLRVSFTTCGLILLVYGGLIYQDFRLARKQTTLQQALDNPNSLYQARVHLEQEIGQATTDLANKKSSLHTIQKFSYATVLRALQHITPGRLWLTALSSSDGSRYTLAGKAASLSDVKAFLQALSFLFQKAELTQIQYAQEISFQMELSAPESRMLGQLFSHPGRDT